MSEPIKAADLTRHQILDLLASFAAQRPGVDPRNYISAWNDTEGRRAYFSETRAITRDLHQARELIAAIRWRESIGAAELREALRRSYSGRLTLGDDGRLSYCTGQYFPTEFRRAVCAVCATALWDYFRDGCGAKTGDDIRRMARRELSRAISKRWFS